MQPRSLQCAVHFSNLKDFYILVTNTTTPVRHILALLWSRPSKLCSFLGTFLSVIKNQLHWKQ